MFHHSTMDLVLYMYMHNFFKFYVCAESSINKNLSIKIDKNEKRNKDIHSNILK